MHEDLRATPCLNPGLFGLAIFEIVATGHEGILSRPVYIQDEPVISPGDMGANQEMLLVVECLNGFSVYSCDAGRAGGRKVKRKQRLRRVGRNIAVGRHAKCISADRADCSRFWGIVSIQRGEVLSLRTEGYQYETQQADPGVQHVDTIDTILQLVTA